MSPMTGWLILLCVLSFIAGMLFFAYICTEADKATVKDGVIKLDGKYYRLTELGGGAQNDQN